MEDEPTHNLPDDQTANEPHTEVVYPVTPTSLTTDNVTSQEQQEGTPTVLQRSPEPVQVDKLQEHRRNALILSLRFLLDHGFYGAYNQLVQESEVSIGGSIDVCDNIDLVKVLQEHEALYEKEYGRKPKYTKSQFKDEHPTSSYSLVHQISNPPMVATYSGMVQNINLPDNTITVRTIDQNNAQQQPPRTMGHSPQRTPPLQILQQVRQQKPKIDTFPNVTTKRINSDEVVGQDEFVQALMQHPEPGMVDQLFQISKPQRRSTRKSHFLQLSDDQEAILYGLVNCDDVGWSIRRIKKETRDYVEERYGINKRILHLFFKNRAQRKRKRGVEYVMLQQFQDNIQIQDNNPNTINAIATINTANSHHNNADNNHHAIITSNNNTNNNMIQTSNDIVMTEPLQLNLESAQNESQILEQTHHQNLEHSLVQSVGNLTSGQEHQGQQEDQLLVLEQQC